MDKIGKFLCNSSGIVATFPIIIPLATATILYPFGYTFPDEGGNAYYKGTHVNNLPDNSTEKKICNNFKGIAAMPWFLFMSIPTGLCMDIVGTLLQKIKK